MASTLSLGLPGDRGSKLRLGMTEVQMPPYKEARFLSGLAKKEKKKHMVGSGAQSCLAAGRRP